MSPRRKTRWLIGLGAAAVVTAGIVAVSTLGSRNFSGDRDSIPTTRVQRGNLELKTYTRGELRPARTAMLVAPPVGGTLQIVELARTGTRVAPGDVVLQFDPSEQEFNLEQARSELAQAEQEIVKMKADADVQAAQDQVALLKARFDVRRAELEVLRKDLIGAIDAKKNELTLEEARRRLAQLEQDIPTRAASNQAALAVLQEKRNKARLLIEQAQKNIENMTLRSTLAGLVAVKDNRDALGGFWGPGIALPEYRPGDLVWPGRFIAEVLEVSDMEILAKVPESDRGNVNPGQAVEVKVDAAPGQTYRGKVKSVAGAASRNFWGGDPMRRFDATFQIEAPSAGSGAADPKGLRPGVTAQVIIVGDQVRNALFLPGQALFEKDGKPVVYVRNGDHFEAREISIKYRTETSIVIEGLSEGTEVALVNPEGRQQKPSKSPAAGPVNVGGGGR